MDAALATLSMLGLHNTLDPDRAHPALQAAQTLDPDRAYPALDMSDALSPAGALLPPPDDSRQVGCVAVKLPRHHLEVGARFAHGGCRRLFLGRSGGGGSHQGSLHAESMRMGGSGRVDAGRAGVAKMAFRAASRTASRQGRRALSAVQHVLRKCPANDSVRAYGGFQTCRQTGVRSNRLRPWPQKWQALL